MSRADPERIYQAQRAGVFMRLTQAERVNERDAERWIEAWELHADEIGLHRATVGFWDHGWTWITEQRRT